MTKANPSRKQHVVSERQLLFTLGMLLAFASISTDLFLPALPAMTESLNARAGELELVVSTYLFGFGFGQLAWGPVSDRLGRKLPILAGLVVFAIGSAGCAMAMSPLQVMLWRIVQALGASAGVALARAMVRDIYETERAASVLSMLMTIMAVAPLLGPSVGAQILAFAGWRAIFWALVAIAAATLCAVSRLRESLPAEDRSSGSLLAAFAAYGRVLRSESLLPHALVIGTYYVGVFASVAAAPSAFITYHGLPPQVYALIFASGILGLMAANTLNARKVQSIGSARMMLIGAAGAALSGIAFFVVTATDFGGATGLAVVQVLFSSMNGFIVANAIAGALAAHRQSAGSAAAVIGAIQYGGGMIGSALVSFFADGTPRPMGALVALSGVASFLFALQAISARR